MLTQNNFSFHLDFFFTERRKNCLDNDIKSTFFYSYKLCRRCQETLKSVAVFLLFLFVRKKKTGRENKSRFFSVKSLDFLAVLFLFLVGFYWPPTIILISGTHFFVINAFFNSVSVLLNFSINPAFA